jgi:uncharacterized protein (TIGR02145 family)
MMNIKRFLLVATVSLFAGVTFTACNEKDGSEAGATVTDADGNTYRTKVYNGVEWMIDNSRKATGFTGCTFPPITPTEPASGIDPAAYGLLYAWSCAAQACPEGWSLPNDTDFDNLAAALDAEGASAWVEDWSSGSSLAGRGYEGSYYNSQNHYGYWWSSSSSGRNWNMDYGDTHGSFAIDDSSNSFSVRCRKSQ